MDIKSNLFFLLLVAAVASSAVPATRDQHEAARNSHLRVRRQDSTTTRAPPKRRPSNIFSLFSTLLAETRDDTRRAFTEIGNLFNSQFSPNTPRPRPGASGPLASSTTAAAPSDGEGSSDDVTTTTEAYRITREEFNGILGSNIRGIVKLFGQELSNAISDSGKNVREFGREFRSQIRPLVEVRTSRKT